MKKLNELVRKITPEKMIGIQIIYLSLALGISYTFANLNPLVLYDNKTIEEWRKIDDVEERNNLTIWVGSFKKSQKIGKEVFNFSLFKNLMIYLIVVDGIIVGYWFLKRD